MTMNGGDVPVRKKQATKQQQQLLRTKDKHYDF